MPNRALPSSCFHLLLIMRRRGEGCAIRSDIILESLVLAFELIDELIFENFGGWHGIVVK